MLKRIFTIFLFIFSISIGWSQSAPTTPTVYATVNHNEILVSWDALAQQSIDSLTGYADFEGYRIYRSKDGGQTWGGENDKLYDFDGNFVGWKPFAQFDYDYDHDINHCIYTSEECAQSDPKRNTSIHGLDPLNPRFSLGQNTGIQYSFVDTNVVDGIEYTYTVTAFDMGLEPFTVSYTDNDEDGIFVADTTFPSTNPGEYTGPDTLYYYDYNGNLIRAISNPNRGFWSLESPKGQTAGDQNFITIVAGYTASNISFPEADDIDALFSGAVDNFGTGDRKYFIVDRRDLAGKTLKFEVNATQGEDAVDGMACEYPSLFIYEIDDSTSQNPVSLISHSVSEYDSLGLDSLLNLPGSELDGNSLTHPDYRMIADFDEWSDLLDGIRFKFDHSIPLYPSMTPTEVNLVDLEWHSQDTTLSQFVDFNLQYNGISSYSRRLNFDYRIDFYKEPVGDTLMYQGIYGVKPIGFPFRITNLWTGKKVGISFQDFIIAPIDFDLGASDYTWTRGEQIKFTQDTLMISGDTTSVFTYKLTLELPGVDDLENMESVVWDQNIEYAEESIVLYKNMLWRAVFITTGDEPIPDFIDNDGDGGNDNPWRLWYPWDTGDYVIVRPQKFYVDGDHWIANLGILGESHDVTDTTLQEIKVVPNPYLVHSRFNETKTERKLRFTHLPQKCRITVYSVTGEVVTTIDHESVYDGNAWWDMRTGNGNLISPGLYIYFVETENGFTHIDKLAVVR